MENTAVAVPAPSLPYDLYREIIWNFQDPSDRPQILALALVNAAWLKESQRVLVRSMCDGSDKLHYWARAGCLARHTRFFQTILDHPQRLGPLVRSYAQVYLARMDHNVIDPGYKLWELTQKTLLLLTNLKQLAIVPERRAGTLRAATVLSRCTFQLTHFSWGYGILNDNRQAERFLLQNGSHLQHFDAGDVDRDLHTMPNSSCPALTSVFCNHASLPRLMDSRRIIGLRVSDNGRPVPPYIDIQPSAADTVKYLSMDEFSLSHTFPNVILLELLVWTIGTMEKLRHVPSLRTLVLHAECEDPNPNFGEDEAILGQLLDEACGRCSRLTCIIQEQTRHWEPGVREFKRFSISREQSQGSARPSDVRCERVTVDRTYFTPWWDIYDTTQ